MDIINVIQNKPKCFEFISPFFSIYVQIESALPKHDSTVKYNSDSTICFAYGAKNDSSKICRTNS